MLNGFAELTRFGDRLFYEDWWNSVTHDEFLRKWNRPVYNYLMKVVYSYARKMVRWLTGLGRCLICCNREQRNGKQ
jgi:arabinogalactan endo-1,4-beta-galactosidase